VAVGLATRRPAGCSTLLIDADVYGGVVRQVLGLLDESARRRGGDQTAAAGTLDVAALAGSPGRSARAAGPTGIARPTAGGAASSSVE